MSSRVSDGDHTHRRNTGGSLNLGWTARADDHTLCLGWGEGWGGGTFTTVIN